MKLDFTPNPKTFNTLDDVIEQEQLYGLCLPDHSKDTVSSIDREQIQTLVINAFSTADRLEEFIDKTRIIVDSALLGANRANVHLVNKIKVLRAQLRRQLYEMVGADTGYYKNDYKVFMIARTDVTVGPTIKGIEAQIDRITDFINN